MYIFVSGAWSGTSGAPQVLKYLKVGRYQNWPSWFYWIDQSEEQTHFMYAIDNKDVE